MSTVAGIPTVDRRGRTVLQNRMRSVLGLIAVCYIALSCRLVFWQVISHDRQQSLSNRLKVNTISIPAPRADIVDRNGNVLATSVPAFDIYANPTLITDPQKTASLIASKCPPGTIDTTTLVNLIIKEQAKTVFDKNSKARVPIVHFKLVSAVPYDAGVALKSEIQTETSNHKSNLTAPVVAAGLELEDSIMRSYPYGTLASHVLGFEAQTDSGQAHGVYGVESSQDSILAGVNGWEKCKVDDANKPIQGAVLEYVADQPGQAIRLTIDTRIQRYAEEQLAQSVQAHNAKNGDVIVLDPKTGEILAMASYPSFDPNNFLKRSSKDDFIDRSTTDQYEPGSTLKTLTLSAVLDHMGLAMANFRVYCAGKLKVDSKHWIHCANDPPHGGAHGSEDMHDVLRNSCNVGAAIFGHILGPVALYRYLNAFGLFDSPSYGLPSSKPVHFDDPSKKRWPALKLANVSFGQGITVTPIQLAAVYATIANHGVRVFPHIVMGQAPPETPYQVVKPEVAAKMLTMLRAVVTDGTGAQAQVADYTIGGKTGSAQVVVNGKYGNTYIGSFCGIAPISNPRLVVLCVMNEPTPVHWGAVVAAPVVRNITQWTLGLMDVPPDAVGQKAYHGPNSGNVALGTPSIKVPSTTPMVQSPYANSDLSLTIKEVSKCKLPHIRKQRHNHRPHKARKVIQ